MSEPIRAQRVADLLLHEVAQIVQREVKDPRIGFVTFTSAKLSPDLRYATVYYTVLGDAQAREGTRRGLGSATPFVRRALGPRLRLKTIPELRFAYDESMEKGLRVQELLEKIGHGSHETDR